LTLASSFGFGLRPVVGLESTFVCLPFRSRLIAAYIVSSLETFVIESSHPESQRLIQWLSPHRRLLVAFSGGVDSSVVLAAASQANLELLVAVTADSPSVPRWQLELSQQIAEHLGVEHLVIPTAETRREDYRQNDSRRCFFCKQTLYETISRLARERFGAGSDSVAGAPVEIASGTNRADLGDYRPGIEAGRDHGVLTPLAELGWGKQAVREVARDFGLPNHDLPASPCLASRIAYGTEVTVDRLRRIEQAESLLREKGFREVRVRLHADELARIEAPKDDLGRLLALDCHGELTRHFRALGFRFVTVDLQGLESGSLNRALVSIQPPQDSVRTAVQSEANGDSNADRCSGTSGQVEVVS